MSSEDKKKKRRFSFGLLLSIAVFITTRVSLKKAISSFASLTA